MDVGFFTLNTDQSIAIDRLALTARGCDRVIRVARTVADLGGSERVEAEHLAEAIRYRSAGGVG